MPDQVEFVPPPEPDVRGALAAAETVARCLGLGWGVVSFSVQNGHVRTVKATRSFQASDGTVTSETEELPPQEGVALEEPQE